MAVIVAPPVTAADVAAWALMVIGVGAVLLSCAGVVVMRTVPDRLHYTAPATLVAPIALALAAFVQRGINLGAVKFAVAAALLAYTGPLVTHTTARAARIRERDGWQLRPEESDEPER